MPSPWSVLRPNRTNAQRYWKEHFDLAAIVARDWATLGPKLEGKVNLFVGGSDTFYLTNAVMDAAATFTALGSDARVTIGAHDGMGMQHCFRGYERLKTSACAQCDHAVWRALYRTGGGRATRRPVTVVSLLPRRHVVVWRHAPLLPRRAAAHTPICPSPPPTARRYEYDATGEPLPNSITRLLYTNFLPPMAERFSATAPDGADVASWRY